MTSENGLTANQRYYRKHRERRLRESNEWKTTHKSKIKEYYESNKAKFQEYQRKYRKNHGEGYNRNTHNWRVRHPEKVKAEKIAYRKVSLDNCCVLCGSIENLLRHHPNYSKPLEIITLCHSCHLEVHANPLILEATK